MGSPGYKDTLVKIESVGPLGPRLGHSGQVSGRVTYVRPGHRLTKIDRISPVILNKQHLHSSNLKVNSSKLEYL